MQENDPQVLFESMNESFKKLEYEFMELEKGYYLLTENFEKIIDHLDSLYQNLVEQKNKAMAKRVLAMRSVIYDLRKKRGYDINAFQSIFYLMKKMATGAPDDILQSKELEKEHLRRQKAFENAQKLSLINSTPLHEDPFRIAKFAEGKLRFTIFINGNMKFLIPDVEITWKKFLPAAKIKDGKLKIKLNPYDNVKEFQLLPGDDLHILKMPPKKHFYIIKNQERENYIIADSYGGYVFIEKHLYEKKLHYLEFSNSNGQEHKQAFLIIRSERYYIREL